MSANGERLPPPDLSHYHENRNKLSLELMTKYAGKHVALSPDGTRIVASGDSEEEMEANVIAAGIHPSQVVGDYIDEPGVTCYLGGLLDIAGEASGDCNGGE